MEVAGVSQAVSNSSRRVRYRRDQLLALREPAVANFPQVLNRVLQEVACVAQELSELDSEHVEVKPPRKRNVDRRARGAEKLARQPVAAAADDRGWIWCGKRDDLSYEPVAWGTKPEHVNEQDVECVVADDVYADSDSDEESFQPRAFAVEGEPDFESGPPEDGWEYLRRVKWEAAQCPKVKVAKIDPRKFASAQTPYVPEIPAVAQCPPELLPRAEWEAEFLADFSELRLTLAGVQVPTDVVVTSLPPVKNKAAWQRLCFGTIPVSTASDDDTQEVADEEAQIVNDEGDMEDEGEMDDGLAEVTGSVLNAEELNHSHDGRVEDSESRNRLEETLKGVRNAEHNPVQCVEGNSSNSQLDDPKMNLDASMNDDGEQHMVESSENELETNEKLVQEGVQSESRDFQAAAAAGPDVDMACLQRAEGHERLVADEGDKSFHGAKADESWKDAIFVASTLALEQAISDGELDESGVANPASKEVRVLQPPELAVVLRLDEVSRAALLRDQVSWLEDVSGLPRERAVWLFALAAVVDKPLDGATSASFRALFRRCADIRASKTNVDEELVMVNIMLTIAGRYFGQAEER